mgnify:CR=1 FL=1|jgi:hypothetical protein
MRLALIICTFILSIGRMHACMCMGERLEESKKMFDVVFVGVLMQIVKSDSLFRVNSSMVPSTYLNFKILKYYKGLEHAGASVSVFEDTESSCKGSLHRLANAGDTFLIFAYFLGTPYNSQFIQTDQCCRISKITNSPSNPNSESDKVYWRYEIRDEERLFLADSTLWKRPNSSFYGFPENKAQVVPKKYPNIPWLLISSVLLNILFATLLWRRKRRKKLE